MLTELKRYQISQTGRPGSTDIWREHLREVFYDHGVRADPGVDFSGVLKKRDVADIGVTYHQATAHSIYRDRTLIERDRVERHCFVFPLSGRFRWSQRSRETVFDAGRMYVVATSEPFEVTTSNDASSFALVLPSELARLICPSLDDKCGMEEIGEPILISAIRGLSDGVLKHQSAIDAVWLRNRCAELLAAALDPRFSTGLSNAWRASDAARLWVIDVCTRCIRERLHERNFGISDAASVCGVSVRYLQTVLKSVGSTFGRELLRARLERAAVLLRSEERRRKQIGEIASECGFRSQAHFATRYRQYFGLTPREEAPSIETLNAATARRRKLDE